MNIDKTILENLYINEKKSCREIGQFFNTSTKKISQLLKEHGISARPFSTKGTVGWSKGVPKPDSVRKKLSEAHKGKKLSKEHRDKVVQSLSYGKVGGQNHAWKGGKYINPKGYIYLRLPDHPCVMSNGYYPEHRFVLEQQLGRYLTKWEVVHHKNRNKHDNSLDNLEIVSRHTHHLITMMEIEIDRLNKEVQELKSKQITS